MNSLADPVYKVGQVLKASRVMYRHVGIVTDRWESGEQMVICCSWLKGKVIEERMSEFLGGFVAELVEEPRALSDTQVLHRARAKLGQPYKLLIWNCEHFMNYCLGRNPESPQLAFAITTALSLLAASRVSTR